LAAPPPGIGGGGGVGGSGAAEDVKHLFENYLFDVFIENY
jgi:hypothetical protein